MKDGGMAPHAEVLRQLMVPDTGVKVWWYGEDVVKEEPFCVV